MTAKFKSVQEAWENCKAYSTNEILPENEDVGRACFFAGAFAMFISIEIQPNELMEEFRNFIAEENFK